MWRSAIAAAALLGGLVGPAGAAGPEKAAEPPAGRWQVMRTQAGLVKLDSATGRMSLCRDESGGLVCTLVPDDRDALLAEIDDLTRRNRMLADRVAELERRAAPGAPAAPSAREPLLSPEDQARIDRFMGLAGEALRRFKGLAEELRDEWDPPPDRT
ncbi:hypothetical protein [Prosthecomicrobium sp. N25]|uniref:hypothetical protein n=1 Tax=Prosthecomicrobium sp. N25 TaxID=3129254 RepID=UPI003076B064